MLEHSGGKYVRCPACPHVLPKWDLERHERVNHATFVCVHCGKVFKHLKQYTVHTLAFHREYACKECGEKCAGSKELSK